MGYFYRKGKIIPTATGFLVTINGVFHLVTARHVINDSRTNTFTDDDIHIFFNTLDGKIKSAFIRDMKKKLCCDWIFHQNSNIDVGIIPFSYNVLTDDLAHVSQDIFLSYDELFELHDIFFISFQPGIEIQQRISPITRTGTISVMNDDGSFYMDAAAFPGNSGSPVFLRPSLLYDEKNVQTMDGGNFIGIISEYLPYKDVAYGKQTGLPRVVFQENTWLSKVWSVSFLNEIVESLAFQQQLSRIPK